MKKESRNKLLIITIFAIAMGFLEAAVVIYLRKLLYPNGFDFPLKGFLDPSILSVEWIREFATIVMLVTISMLAAKKLYERFAYFLYAFAIWDVFYYVFLKLVLDWPSSLLTWDMLFLIPWVWVGPVLAPLICCVLFIAMTFIILNFEDKGIKVKINVKEWSLMIIGVVLVLYTWLYDYGKIIFSGYAKDFFTLTNNEQFMQIVNNYVPQNYNWPVFLLGVVFVLVGMAFFYFRSKRKKK
ncbi:MAG: hypothetical protein WC413_01475 [Candidatus Nanoarchaeia archaeon]